MEEKTKMPVVYTPNVPEKSKKTSWSFFTILGLTAIACGGFYFGRKAYIKWQANKALNDISNPLNAFATRFYNALDGSALFFPSVNIDEILKIAPLLMDSTGVSKYPDVAAIYKKAYRKNLTEQLQNAMGDKYAQFTNLLKGSSNGGGGDVPSDTEKVASGMYAVTTKEVNVRTAPKVGSFIEEHTPFMSNIIDTIPAGKLIGKTTGAEFYDSANNTVFVEIYTKPTGSGDFSDKNYAWKGALEFLDEAKAKTRFGSPIVDKAEVLSGVSGFGILSGTFSESEISRVKAWYPCIIVSSKWNIPVYDTQGKFIARSGGKTMLGKFLNRSGQFIYFETIQGNQRVIKDNDAILTKSKQASAI